VAATIAAAARIGDAILVVATPRWASSTTHWYSTVRRLIRHAAYPVLVVPSDDPD
jgi:hypothetical protein